MKSIQKLIDEIYKSCKIPFQIIIDDSFYNSPLFDSSQQYITKNFKFEYTKCCINVNAAFSSIIDLLIYCLEDKLQEVIQSKKQNIVSLLRGEKITNETLNGSLSALSEPFYIVTINVDNNIENIYSYIKECYCESDIEIIIYKNSVLMLGQLEDADEHMESIKETIENTYAGKFYISYKLVNTLSELKKCYEDTLHKITLARKYNINECILNDRKMIIESILDSLPNEVENNIIEVFNDGFSQLDDEMIKTIEIFFKCGLNLSEAAKKLYIHRNTLIYRLDKIQKCTGYDLREFNSAVLFKIVFFLWIEKNN